MAYDFHSRLDHAGTRFKEMGEEVTYYDGENSGSLTAFPILQAAEEIVPGLAVTRIEMQLWGIDAADLIPTTISGEAIPKIGNKIVRSNGDEFKVVSPGGDEPCFRYATADRERLLVFTEWTKRG